MCQPTFPETPKCRARQLFEASERLIDTARIVADKKDAVTMFEVKYLTAALINLKHDVDVFDRLNRGL